MHEMEHCCNKSVPIYIMPDDSVSRGARQLLPVVLYNYLYRTWYVSDLVRTADGACKWLLTGLLTKGFGRTGARSTGASSSLKSSVSVRTRRCCPPRSPWTWHASLRR